MGNRWEFNALEKCYEHVNDVTKNCLTRYKTPTVNHKKSLNSSSKKSFLSEKSKRSFPYPKSLSYLKSLKGLFLVYMLQDTPKLM